MLSNILRLVMSASNSIQNWMKQKVCRVEKLIRCESYINLSLYIIMWYSHICAMWVIEQKKTIRRRRSARRRSARSFLSSRGRLSHQIAIKAFRCWAAFASLIRDKLKLRFHRESGSLVFIFIKHPLNVLSSSSLSCAR